MKHSGTETIKTARLTLRRFSVDDAQAMFNNWANDPVVTKYLTWKPHGDISVTENLLKEWVGAYEDASCYNWAIVPDGVKEPIGSIAVVECNENVGSMHIGYCISQRWWHRRITSEALAAVIEYLFKTTDVNRIDSRHDSKNPNSGRVMSKCGMKYEGTLRMSDMNNTGVCDACYYSILRSEYNFR